MKSITLELPEEFIRLCHDYHTNPEEALKGFIADVTPIMNRGDRTDDYSSNGSDERDLAWNYFKRVGYPYRAG